MKRRSARPGDDLTDALQREFHFDNVFGGRDPFAVQRNRRRYEAAHPWRTIWARIAVWAKLGIVVSIVMAIVLTVAPLVIPGF